MKTRLIPALGADGACGLHRRLVLRTLRTAEAFCRGSGVELEIRFDGHGEDALWHWLGDDWRFRPQMSGDLGARMAEAFDAGFREGSPAVVVIGSDSPGLTPEHLAQAFARLGESPIIFGPAKDGGYYLIGLRYPVPELFGGISWGTETVLSDSLRRLGTGGIAASLLEPLHDIDRPEDLPVWQRLTEAEDADLSQVSVVIPALNEAQNISVTLQAVQRGSPHEVVVVDGGSTDATVALARSGGARVRLARPGRAIQMNAGAAQARGNVLLFLHADTQLAPAWRKGASQALTRPEVVAGAFRFRIAEPFRGRWIVESTTRLRSRWFQRPYGDQALFLRRAVFEEVGGFADLPILEDYEFVRRLRRRGRIVILEEEAVTSGRRWRELGVVRTTLINKLVLAGHRLGIEPRTLAALYRRGAGRLNASDKAGGSE